MRLVVKDLDLAGGEVLIAVLNYKDAKKLDVRPKDRIEISFKGKKLVAVADISGKEKPVSAGQIGLFEEILSRFGISDHGTGIVEVKAVGKPESVGYIREKLFGKRLNYKKLYAIIKDIVDNRLEESEITYFVSAGFAHGFTEEETFYLTKAMVETGHKLKFPKPVFDLHSIGGVPGNRTTMVVVPIVAAAGLTIPKTASRAITSPSGTSDTMEVLARVDLTAKEMERTVKKVKGCIVWGGAMDLAPADDKIIKVEHPLSIDAEGQMLASVMAKKASVGADYLLTEIPIGPTAKCRNKKEAEALEEKFISLARRLRIKNRVIITDGSQPVGRGIGPVLEARDVMWVLKNDKRAPSDLRERSLLMAGILLEMAGRKNGHKIAVEMLESGRAYEKMQEIIRCQGRQPEMAVGTFTYVVHADKSGKVKRIDNGRVAKLAKIAGAPDDKGAGVYLEKKVGAAVKKGEKLFTIYAENKMELDAAVEEAKRNKIFVI